jgi:carboxynorspermidine decarboxylase
MPLPLEKIQTPAYVIDIGRLEKNLAVIKDIKKKTGCQVVLALKAFAQYSLFDLMRETLDGTTASGLFEAKLGHNHFGKAVQVYSPAFSLDEITQLMAIATHIYFNSLTQLSRFAPLMRAANGDLMVGLRVNPQISLVKNNVLYDPSTPGSRFGVAMSDLTPDVLAQLDSLHIHNLCENMAEDSVALIDHLIAHIPDALHAISSINLGGGHYVTHHNYDVHSLCVAINRLQEDFQVNVTLEPGGTIVYDAGYLVATVLDIVENERKIAILDTSATCHMPDVLEVPYRPNAMDSGPVGKLGHDYTLAGKTCLTGDVIGHYSFAKPLLIGDKIVFTDMAQYTMVKNTTFNGMPLPSIGILDTDNTYHVIKQFGYEDFWGRL